MRGIVSVLAVFVVALLSSSAATGRAATPRPDSHDRALISRLAAKATTFQTVTTTTSDKRLQKSLDNCAPLKKDPSALFAAAIALLPALLSEVVNEAKPQLVDLRDTLAGMDAHAPLFDQWLATEADSFRLILRFDNHGKKIDYCKAATVMLDKKSTAQDIRNVLGIDPAAIATLFDTRSSSVSARLKRLNPQMRPFFVAGGLSAKMARALTT